MSLKLILILLTLSIIGAFVTYYLAKKYNNKKILIPTYVFIGLSIVWLICLTLEFVVVGGI